MSSEPEENNNNNHINIPAIPGITVGVPQRIANTIPAMMARRGGRGPALAVARAPVARARAGATTCANTRILHGLVSKNTRMAKKIKKLEEELESVTKKVNFLVDQEYSRYEAATNTWIQLRETQAEERAEAEDDDDDEDNEDEEEDEDNEDNNNDDVEE